MVSLSIEDEFTVDEGTRVEEGGIFRCREMKVRDAVIVVFAVDEVCCFGAIRVGGQVHQATDAVRFLADIVVLVLELCQMAGREADRLCAWKAEVISTTQKPTDLFTERAEEMAFCPFSGYFGWRR